MTTPRAGVVAFAFNSCKSATSNSISSSWSMFVPAFAEMSTNTVLPPHSSYAGCSHCFTTSCRCRVFQKVPGTPKGRLSLFSEISFGRSDDETFLSRCFGWRPRTFCSGGTVARYSTIR